MLKSGTANGKVGLHAIRGAFLQIDRGIQLQVIDPVRIEQRLLARVDHRDRTVDVLDRRRYKRSRNGDGFFPRWNFLVLAIGAGGVWGLGRLSC
ncbi:MAG: hypothetical protein ABSG08_10685 [Terriglobales bacterium]